jgi:membrane-associated protease RseP (regulator of RpoE activity)
MLNLILLIFNLLPIPPLDGYHAVCSLVEMAIRRELPERGQSILLTLGWLLILGWLGLNLYLILRDLLGTVF